MPSKKRTLSVRLDPQAERRLERAATLQKQSRGAFLERAGDELASRVLLDWAVERYRTGERTFSELAEETGLNIEQIMDAVTERDGDAGLQMFLDSCKAIARAQHDPQFLELAEKAIEVASKA